MVKCHCSQLEFEKFFFFLLKIGHNPQFAVVFRLYCFLQRGLRMGEFYTRYNLAGQV